MEFRWVLFRSDGNDKYKGEDDIDQPFFGIEELVKQGILFVTIFHTKGRSQPLFKTCLHHFRIGILFQHKLDGINLFGLIKYITHETKWYQRIAFVEFMLNGENARNMDLFLPEISCRGQAKPRTEEQTSELQS